MKYLVKCEIQNGNDRECQDTYETDDLFAAQSTYIEWVGKMNELEFMYLFENYDTSNEKLLASILGGTRLSGRDIVIKSGLLKCKTLRASSDVMDQAYQELANINQMCFDALTNGFKYDKANVRYIPLSSTMVMARRVAMEK